MGPTMFTFPFNILLFFYVLLYYLLGGFLYYEPDFSFENMLPVLIVSFIVTNLIIFCGLPFLALKLGKPVSRRKLFIRMLIFAAVCAAINWWYLVKLGEAKAVEDLGEKDLLILMNMSRANIAAPFVFAFLGYNIIKFTRGVDVKMPREYLAVRPVKAVVTEIDNITAVEYGGKRYLLSKDFPFKLRDRTKVRIIEGSEKAYLS